MTATTIRKRGRITLLRQSWLSERFGPICDCPQWVDSRLWRTLCACYRVNMRVMNTLIWAMALALMAGVAWACSCPQWRSAEDQLGFADIAFVGKAMSSTTGRDGYVITEFVVSRTLKGAHQDVQRIAHAPGSWGATCGIDFVQSHDVLVLAKRQGGRMSTSSCATPRFGLGDFERAAVR